MSLPNAGFSESVLATRATEQRYRVATPNSKPRAAVLVGLDAAARELVATLVAERPDRRRAFDLAPGDLAGSSDMSAWLADLSAHTTELTSVIAAANIVVVVASAGADAQAAATIGDACRAKGVRMTALVVNAKRHSDAEVAATLAQMRPTAAMVVVAGDDVYVADMLQALQA